MPRATRRPTNDALNLAAFRWMANTIENKAIVRYVTRPDAAPEILAVLRETLKALDAIQMNDMSPVDETFCPDGWVLCDGLCMPSCDFFAAQLPAEGATRVTRVKAKGRRR